MIKGKYIKKYNFNKERFFTNIAKKRKDKMKKLVDFIGIQFKNSLY